MNQIITTINLYLMMVTVILLSVLVLVVCVKGRSKHISSILKKSDKILDINQKGRHEVLCLANDSACGHIPPNKTRGTFLCWDRLAQVRQVRC